MLVVFLLSCGRAPESAGCDKSELVEIPGQVAPGWTPAAGCTVVCEDTDGGGLEYSDCYLTPDNSVVCQYKPDC